MTNYQRTAAWLAACGKSQSISNLSVQIGCHLEEVVEFLDQIDIIEGETQTRHRLAIAAELLEQVGATLKSGKETAFIPTQNRERALDALCDQEVTLNGVAYLAGFQKDGADAAVLGANDAKLVDGKPVLKEGGKIGKPPGWVAPDLSQFV